MSGESGQSVALAASVAAEKVDAGLRAPLAGHWRGPAEPNLRPFRLVRPGLTAVRLPPALRRRPEERVCKGSERAPVRSPDGTRDHPPSSIARVNRLAVSSVQPRYVVGADVDVLGSAIEDDRERGPV